MKRLLKVLLPVLLLAALCCPFAAQAAPKNVIPVFWADLMVHMDWDAESYSYSVGTGERQVNVSRVGDHTTITGGHVSSVRMVRKDLWDEDHQAVYGWHTEPGTYTFSDVVLHGQNTLLEVWANDDDEFRVILESDVKGARVLEGSETGGGSMNASLINQAYQMMQQNGYSFEVIEGGFGIDVHAKKESSVEIVNNTLVDTCTFTPPLYVSMDRFASFSLSGTGKLRTSSPLTRDLELDRKVHMILWLEARAEGSDQAAVEQFADALSQRVHIDEAQFDGANGRPQIYCGYYRTDVQDPYMEVEMDLEQVIVNAPLAQNAPQLQMHTADSDAAILKTQACQTSGSEMLFFANVLNANEESWRVQQEAQLYLPYPEGITAANAQNYLFSVAYPNPMGEAPMPYSSQNGTIEPTAYGLRMTVEDVFPFKLQWEENAQSPGIYDENDAESLPPVDSPVLILPEGTQLDPSARLVYDMPDADHNGRIVYNVHLVNDQGEDLPLPAGAVLCFPYPEGINQQSGRKYIILIHHTGAEGTEVFKSEDGTIELNRLGLCIRVRSLSPFVITWESKPETSAPPQTGDTSRTGLWLVLMLLSGAGIVHIRKKRLAEKQR